MNETATTTQTPPAPSATLTLGELLAVIIEAGISFDFAYRSEGKPGKHYMAEVSEQRAFGDDAVTTLLEAVAKGVRAETDADQEARKVLERSAAKMAKINAMLPGLQAHAPAADGELCGCGQKRGHPLTPAGMLEALLGRSGLVVVSDDETPGAEPTKKKTH